MAFTIEERQVLGIHGLLPAAVKTQDEQVELCRLNLERYTDELSKYIYLIGLLVHTGETRLLYRFGSEIRIIYEIYMKYILFLLGQKRETLLPFGVRECKQNDAADIYANCRSGVSEVRSGLSQASRPLREYPRSRARLRYPEELARARCTSDRCHRW